MNQNQHNYNNDQYDAIDDDGDDHEYYQLTHYDDWQTHDTDYGDYYGITEEDGDDHEYYDDEYAENVINNLYPQLEIYIDEDGDRFEVDPSDDEISEDEGFCEEPEFFYLPTTKVMPNLEKYIEISIRHYMNKYTGYRQPYIDDIFKAFDKYINGRFFSDQGTPLVRKYIREQAGGRVEVVFELYKHIGRDTYHRFNYIDIEQLLVDVLCISEEEQQEYYYKP